MRVPEDRYPRSGPIKKVMAEDIISMPVRSYGWRYNKANISMYFQRVGKTKMYCNEISDGGWSRDRHNEGPIRPRDWFGDGQTIPSAP